MEGAPALVRQLGRMARTVGQSLDGIGISMQDKMAYVETLVPSTRVVAFKSKELQHGGENFVASTATVVGDVKLSERASAWYGATVRGDRATVTIGRNSSVMDNAIVSTVKGMPTTIGEDVTICAGAVVQSASIGDGTMIGMGAVVMPGAVVGPDCFIDAGAIVSAGTKIPAGQLWTGAPAKLLRSLSPDEMSFMRSNAVTQSSLGLEHASQLSLDTASLERQSEIRYLKMEGGFAPDMPVTKPDADVVEYYKLTTYTPDVGLFRGKENDYSTEFAAREAEEVAADAAEDAYYAALARSKRVGEAMSILAAGRTPAAADKAVADLEARDPEGAAILLGIVARVSQTASVPTGSPEKESVLRDIAQVSPVGGMGATIEERNAAVAGIFDALAKHAKGGMRFLGQAGSASKLQ